MVGITYQAASPPANSQNSRVSWRTSRLIFEGTVACAFFADPESLTIGVNRLEVDGASGTRSDQSEAHGRVGDRMSQERGGKRQRENREEEREHGCRRREMMGRL